MVSRSDIERYRQANMRLSELVRAELERLFTSLDLSRPEAVRDALLEVIPALVSTYGDAAAALAAEWYEELREASGASGRFTALAAPQSIPTGAVEAKVRYLAGHLFTDEPEAMLGPLQTATDKYVKQPGRDTIAYNAKREAVRWARVPTGAETCTWCLILASRDAVYKSERSATFSDDGDRYHGDCDCLAVRIDNGEGYPDGYLPDEYYERYMIARDEAGSGGMEDITAAYRRLFPETVSDGAHSALN